MHYLKFIIQMLEVFSLYEHVYSEAYLSALWEFVSDVLRHVVPIYRVYSRRVLVQRLLLPRSVFSIRYCVPTHFKHLCTEEDHLYNIVEN